MYEKDVKFTSEHAPHASSGGATATRGTTTPRGDASARVDTTTRGATATRGDSTAQRNDPKTDPKFVRESNTMRKMHTWQIAALAIAALVVVALVLFYI